MIKKNQFKHLFAQDSFQTVFDSLSTERKGPNTTSASPIKLNEERLHDVKC